MILLAPTRLFAVGWTPTDGGLVVNLDQGDRFLLSVMVGEKEYFVCNYNRYTGGDFNYTAGLYLKLIPQAADATEPSQMSIWTVGAPLSRVIGGKNYDLGGTVYTIWNDGKTLRMKDNNNFQFLGDLTSDYNYKDAADVVFIIPTDQSSRTSFDPNCTLKKDRGRDDQEASGKINSKIGKGFLGMTYREVYMLDIPKQNSPISYTNAALVTFNTTDKQKSWSDGQIKCDPGHAAYAYADNKHKPTTRTLFRLYLLDKPFNYCSSYYFATDEQDFKNYRSTKDLPGDSTEKKKIYTIDWMTPMTAENKATSPLYKTGLMNIPVLDSTYYYVGYNNDYKADAMPSDKMGNPGAYSQFEKIRSLPMKDLTGFTAPAGAYGRMVVDTTSTDYNLGVTFEPAGYMLKVNSPSGTNVRLVKTGDHEWTTQDMWAIDDTWLELSIKATLMSGAEFSEEDPGEDVDLWSVYVKGKDVPLGNGEGYVTDGATGYARIYTNSTEANGNLTFFLADETRHIHYNNNGFLGVEIPDHYPLAGDDPKTVTIKEPRLKTGYTFDGWNTQADGKGTTYLPGATYTFESAGEVELFAQAHYDGTYNVAVSFMHGGKRYFLTHPGSEAPRYARARTYDDWTNVMQGMANAENVDPMYVNTFELRHPSNEVKANHDQGGTPLQDNEMVFDPRRYMMRGYEDSLMLYENFAPAKDEYLGLYYTAPNTILANNTWAGLFVADKWPDFREPSVQNVKLRSTRYVEEEDPVNHPDSLTIKVRSNNASGTYVKYIPATNQFDGCVSPDTATEFQISSVIVADAHYIVLPDTSEVWREQITFGYHKDEPMIEPVWSKLIGKQLMMCMMVGNDTTYFHPNPKKIIDDPNNLYLSQDFRVTQLFELIRDSRVSAPLHEGDSVMHETTDHYWHHNIVSGNSSPLNVTDAGGNCIDIVDTFRITLSQGGISKIKEYRGRWKKQREDDGLHINPDGSRYRDIIVTTKTYHEGGKETNLVLEPQYETYSFSPLAGIEKQINFRLVRETSRSLLDKDNNPVSTVVVKRDTLGSTLALGPGSCTLKGTNFDIDNEKTTGDHVTLKTLTENTTGVDHDTLTVTTTVNDTAITVRVPLMQAALTSNELLWSVVDGGKRYFILAKENGFVFRQYRVNNSIMYKEGSSIHLIKGTADDANSDGKYITPWEYRYVPETTNQLTLKANLKTVLRHFKIDDTTPTVHATDSTVLTYEIVRSYTNDNANYEEQVKLQYGGLTNGWLKFSNGALTLTDYEHASTFSWSYLVQEYSLLNNGTYPSRESVVFGYNEKTSVSVQTRYKAYKEYSTLLNNAITYLCRQEETNVANLRNNSKEWLTDMTFSLIRDSRFTTSPAASMLDTVVNRETLTTTVTTDNFSPIGTKYGGVYSDIVDTLDVRLSLQSGAPAYRFKGEWSKFKSVNDACLKIPLIRKTYHIEPFDSLYAKVEHDQFIYTFPATITKGTNDSCVFTLNTYNRTGSHMLDVEGQPVRSSGTSVDISEGMDFTNKNYAEIRLVDEYGNTPDWCHIRRKTTNSIVVECTKNGVRSPRSAFLYLAYIIMIDHDKNPETPDVMRFVNYRLTVAQASSFTYKNNQVLVHSSGASGDEKMENGMQQVHTNKRVLYYYPEQDVELPVRERAFYGWWRWYREGNDVNGVDVSDTDIPDSLWRTPPYNRGKFTFPYRIIGDSVDDGKGGKKLVTMGRYTVFHYKSKDYNNKADPPAKTPTVAPPITDFGLATKPTLTYAVDISNYYDNLPMSVKDKNQVDVDLLDTALTITEPTLSLREVFELHPWTEMAARLNGFKSARTANDAGTYELASENYMEDHVVMAPIGNRLLLQTEQRYNNDNLVKKGHSESLLGYYMYDDHWSDGGWDLARKDTMIWCGGWDAPCLWYTYDQDTKKYTRCEHSITEDDDFLQVPAKGSISAGHEFDTVYYCLRARSMATTGIPGSTERSDSGAYMFNICRYKIIYHNPNQYGPKLETTTRSETKAIISKEEIEQRYEVLERLNFDYVKPGKDYHVYPHPLPWADASYGYTYPETPDLPHNRYHDESDFPNHGEYGLINRIPYSTYWHKMEQHGGAENGYMIYCDGMASAGQVAALTLETNLCAGQKMFFSGYVGNPSSQTGKSDPNFIFSVQGSLDGKDWEDITSYMTGDIKPSNQWYQIFFPIRHIKEGDTEYRHFRVHIYNVANSFDGNDFIIDDMCIFATKPPLIAYQAQTTCNDYGHSETDTHVLLRIDYQGITGEGYNGKNVCYTVRQMTKDSLFSFVPMTDGYLNDSAAHDTIFGKIYIPLRSYEPQDKDSIYRNMNELLARFEATKSSGSIVREGYIYEILEGDIRPVKYIVHSAAMKAQNEYTVHMSGRYKELLSSICGMTSHLKVSNRMVLELNGEEQPETEQLGLCSNSTYDISLRVKGSMYQDSVAPIDVTGSCINDWLLYGDTAEASSLARYGFKYKDIVKVVSYILRYPPMSEHERNGNQFAPNLASIDRAELNRVQTELSRQDLTEGVDPYALLDSLVSKGFLILYKSQLTASVMTGDSLQYVILPIVGTGSQEVSDARVEVCPNPILIKLKPDKGEDTPLIAGGLKRDSTESKLPVCVLASAQNVNSQFKLRVDSIRPNIGIYSVELRSTDDPDYREGVHTLKLMPDRKYPSEGYYVKGDSILFTPAAGNNYRMRAGYNYTFNIVLQTLLGQLRDEETGCEVGTVPFTLSIVPNYVRWNPQSTGNNNWNDAANWLGIDEHNQPLHNDAHFVPLENTFVLIPTAEDGMSYPVVQPLPTVHKDSIQKVGFQYNRCNTIRFLPGAAIGQQQRMNFSSAVVDMAMPEGKWAFRSSPVKGMISGDLYMARADVNNETPLWEVGAFDVDGRNYQLGGNASFWLSVYNTQTEHLGQVGEDGHEVREADTEWSKVTNALTLPLPAGKGWAVYTKTTTGNPVVRLPKNDDQYYYYGSYGEKLYDRYEPNLQTFRNTVDGGDAGTLAFHPDGEYEEYTLANGKEDTVFVFGNPTMGYIDIWGFIADNCLVERFDFMDESPAGASVYTPVSKSAAEATTNVITEPKRYLPPMHAIIVKTTPSTSLSLVLNLNRVVTETSQVVPAIRSCGISEGNPAPERGGGALRKGIMTVTVKNPVAPRCVSRLQIGQGYHADIRDGEDAILSTINVTHYSNTAAPATPFNIYAAENGYGLSIDLLDSIVNVPISFDMSNLPYDPVTQLWFTGVNNIDGPLVLFDMLTGTEQPIIDGICLNIETPAQSHQRRYYIRRRGFDPEQGSGEEIPTDIELTGRYDEPAYKIIHNGHVYIIHNGHVFTMMGGRVR